MSSTALSVVPPCVVCRSAATGTRGAAGNDAACSGNAGAISSPAKPDCSAADVVTGGSTA